MNTIRINGSWLRGIAAKALFVLVAAMVGTSALAQSYPNRPIRLIVGFGAGGVSDVIARIAADELGKRLGQPVIVENRPGAGGLIGALAVKNAQPDGYTLLSGALTTVTPIFIKENPLVASKELAPVSVLAIGGYFFYVRGDLGVNTLAELAAYGKANPGKLKLASTTGVNTAIAALIAKRLGFDFQTIPYKTTDQTVIALLNGESDLALTQLSGFAPHLQSGKIRAVASLGATRTKLLSSVPTAMEQGVQIEIYPSQGIWAPLGTPRDIIARLNAAISETVKAPAAAEKIANVSMIPSSSTPDELVRQFESENRIYSEAVSLIGLQPQ